MHSYPHGPSESKSERRSKTEAPRAFAPASRSGKHPAYRQLFAPFFFTVFDQHGITWQQYNVLRILRGAGLGGLRHWTSQRG